MPLVSEHIQILNLVYDGLSVLYNLITMCERVPKETDCRHAMFYKHPDHCSELAVSHA